MKDFPVFTTENGIASLKMNQIPYTGSAYITIQDTCDPQSLIGDCLEFCCAAGAAKVYATGHDYLTAYPLHTHIYRMRLAKDAIGDTDAAIFPVTEKTVSDFISIYNEKMQAVPNAAYLSSDEAQRLLEDKNAYFVHRGGTLLGIAIGSGGVIQSLAACVPGMGQTVIEAICHALTADTVELEVASENHKAMRLYERMGFTVCEHLLSWYKIFEDVK